MCWSPTQRLPLRALPESFSQDEIGRALRVNLESAVRMTHELLPRWQQRGSGHFVFVSSISGFASTPRASLFAATKFGLRGFAPLPGIGTGTPQQVGNAVVRDRG
jgi:NAD(P)-dependent dehydrogenase (short-subunit alcohol dehydrogenase family)